MLNEKYQTSRMKDIEIICGICSELTITLGASSWLGVGREMKLLP